MTKDSVIDIIHKTIYDFFDVVEDDSEEPINEKDKLLLEVNKTLCNAIKEMPDERKTGKWIKLLNGNMECSECWVEHPIDTNYCPWCGAKMEGVK